MDDNNSSSVCHSRGQEERSNRHCRRLDWQASFFLSSSYFLEMIKSSEDGKNDTNHVALTAGKSGFDSMRVFFSDCLAFVRILIIETPIT